MKTVHKTISSIIADKERDRILRDDILGGDAIRLHPLPAADADKEISRFGREIWDIPNMEGYFDPTHIINMKAHVAEVEHGFMTLAKGGILEILVVPVMPDNVMGFHIFSVFDPRDDSDRGRLIGYSIYSLEKGKAPFGQAEAVRLAFDIFPEFREGRFKKVLFTNHEIYNASRRILIGYKPTKFLVDARTQISQTRTGDRFKRTVYYLKRGYYPPDQKLLADACLARLLRGKPINQWTTLRLLDLSKAPFWVFPVKK